MLFLWTGYVQKYVCSLPQLIVKEGFTVFLKPLNTAEQGKEITVMHQYAAVGVVMWPLLFVAGAGAATFWVLGNCHEKKTTKKLSDWMMG